MPTTVRHNQRFLSEDISYLYVVDEGQILKDSELQDLVFAPPVGRFPIMRKQGLRRVHDDQEEISRQLPIPLSWATCA